MVYCTSMRCGQPASVWKDIWLLFTNWSPSFDPSIVIIDPITNLVAASGISGVKSMLMRLVDFLKVEQITSMFTNLTFAGDPQERTAAAVSSLMDTWIVLRDSKPNGRPRRELHVLKSRGMAHSREARELIVSDRGIELGIVLRDHTLATTVTDPSSVAATEEQD